MGRKKYNIFVTEPVIDDEPVTAVHGIGSSTARKLNSAGISNAQQLLGVFLRWEGYDTGYEDWLKQTVGANNSEIAHRSHNCLKEWCRRNFPALSDFDQVEVDTIRPGVDRRLKEQLTRAGYRYAKALFGKYLELGENRTLFTTWLQVEMSASQEQSTQCFDFLQGWGATYFHPRTDPGSMLGRQVPSLQNTTMKHRNFVSEPMGEKKATEMPGVGKVLGQKLADACCPRARDVRRRYIQLDGELHDAEFIQWLMGFGATRRRAQQCYDCLKEWCQQHDL